MNNLSILFRMRITIMVNTFIYVLKKIPIIKLFFNGDYAYKNTKTLIRVVAVIFDFIKHFVQKTLYIYILYLLPLQFIYKTISIDAFLTLFIVMSIIGGVINNDIFMVNKNAYNAIILMKFNAKDYVKSLMIEQYGKILICYFVIFGLMSKTNQMIPQYFTIVLPLIIISCKSIVWCIILMIYKYKEKITKIDVKHTTACFIVMLAVYGLVYYKITMPLIVSYMIIGLILICGLISLKVICSYNEFQHLYKRLLRLEEIEKITVNSKDITKQSMQKIIDANDLDYVKHNHKNGYAFLNDIFMKRHHKSLWSFTYKTTCVILGIGACLLIGITVFKKQLPMKEITELASRIIYYIPLLIYFVNPGQKVAQMLYINCDSALLTYAFYRDPKVILSLFKERVKSLIMMNLLPTGSLFVVYVGLLLMANVSLSITEILLAGLTILVWGAFFSVHQMILYYLLQPYDRDCEIKRPLFSIINAISYVLCYQMIYLKVDVLSYVYTVLLLAFIYSVVATLCIYYIAPKTFKIRK